MMRRVALTSSSRPRGAPRSVVVTLPANVVLVDDDASMRGALERLLAIAGWTCAAFESAEALLASGAVGGAACVVTDIRLPGMSGLALLARLRERGTAVPVVVITAHDAPGMREDAMQRGAAGYLAKPFRGTVLLEVVRAVIAAGGRS